MARDRNEDRPTEVADLVVGIVGEHDRHRSCVGYQGGAQIREVAAGDGGEVIPELVPEAKVAPTSAGMPAGVVSTSREHKHAHSIRG